MRVENIFGATLKEIKDRNFNIFIAISIGNKYLTKNLKSYVQWGLDHTKSDVLGIVADSIQAINYEVFYHSNHTRALKRALKQGNKYLQTFHQVADELQTNRLKIIRWNDFANNPDYQNQVKAIKEEFQVNKDFSKYIKEMIVSNLGEKAVTNLNTNEMNKLAEYLMNELPTLLNGITYEDKIYNEMVAKFILM